MKDSSDIGEGHCASEWGGRETGKFLFTDDEVRALIAAEREDMAFDQCCKMSLFAEIERLQASRSAEGDRLDWLLCNLHGNILRDLVGELSDTSDVAEWRAAIDRAAGFLPPNAR